MAFGLHDEGLQQIRAEKRLIAGDDDDMRRPGAFEGCEQAADRASSLDDVRVDGHAEVHKPGRLARDDEDLGSDPLQDLELPYDDGVSVDDEAALVSAAETPSTPAGKNGGSRRSDHGPIMTEARIGRLLGACLHQAIGERLPQRLEFYEYWLNSQDLRDGRIELAAMTAVTGFLRTEGEAYRDVMSRAGSLAAEWTVASLPSMRRRAIEWLPRRLRARAALGVAAGIARATSTATRISTRVNRNSARVEFRESLFCSVRDAQAVPLCDFYLAAALDTLRCFGIAAEGRIERCHAVDPRGSCLVVLELAGSAEAPRPAIAA